MSNQSPAPITKAEFAKLVGVSKQMVGKGLARRVPEDCLVYVERAGKRVAMIADVERAKRAWLESADHSRAPSYVKERAAPRGPAPAPAPRAASAPAGSDPEEDGPQSLAEETAREKFWKANLAELDFKKRSGELVEAKEWEAKVADVFTRVRVRLLGIPTRAKQQLPDLTTPQIAVVDALVREALEELALDLEHEDAAAPQEAASA